MEPIRVPRPPKEAFNKNRPVSDLIRKQVEHFRHVEHKLPEALRRNLPQGHIRTEQEAAQYIHAMTQILVSRPTATAEPQAPVVMPRRPARTAARGLQIAAAAQTSAKAAKKAKAAAAKTRGPRKGKKG